jgi:hypothetical protein
MADYVWTSYHQDAPSKVFRAETTRKYCEHLTEHCSDFALLRDVAEAHKHMRLDRPASPARRIRSSSSSRTENIPGDALGSGGLGSFVLGGEAVVIDLDDGTQRIFGEVLRNVIEMWEDLIKRMNL